MATKQSVKEQEKRVRELYSEDQLYDDGPTYACFLRVLLPAKDGEEPNCTVFALKPTPRELPLVAKVEELVTLLLNSGAEHVDRLSQSNWGTARNEVP